MLHKRLTHDFSSILNGHLDAAAAKSKPSLLLNRQFPVMRISVSGTKRRSKSKSMGKKSRRKIVSGMKKSKSVKRRTQKNKSKK
jgi:hypothetical protein